MSIQTEIDRIISAVHAAHEKVAEKGGTTAEPYLVANLESAIESIPEATTEDLSAELDEYESLNAELESVIDSLPSAGGGSAVETCTVTVTIPNSSAPTTVSSSHIAYTKCTDGVIEAAKIDLEATGSAVDGTYTINNVVCGSVISVVATMTGTFTEFAVSDAITILFISKYTGLGFVKIDAGFSAPTSAGAMGEILTVHS